MRRAFQLGNFIYIVTFLIVASVLSSILTCQCVAAETYPLFGSDISLGTIVVSAHRAGSPRGSYAEAMEVYSARQIVALPARDLSEALSFISGVDVSVRNQFGQPTAVSIRGCDPRQVLVMVDGIPFNSQLSGQVNPARIPLEHIERIEVIKGGASNVWGSALGGVINVITKPAGQAGKTTGTFTTTYGAYSTTKNSLELSGGVGDIGYFSSGSFMKTDGIKSRSAVEEIKTYHKITKTLGDQAKLTGSFGYSGADVLDGVNPNNRWYSMPYQTRYGTLQLDVGDNEHAFHSAYKYKDYGLTSDIYNATTNALVFSTQSRDLYHGVTLQTTHKVGESDTAVFGVDLDRHTLKSNNYLSVARSVTMQAPYVNYTVGRFEPFTYIGGLRFDRNDQFGSQLSPSVGVVYAFDAQKTTTVNARISRAFNAPPLLWLYNDDPAWLTGPNPDLTAERAVIYEAGIKTSVIPRLDLEVNGYRSDVKDGIATVYDAVAGVYIKDNFDKFIRQGAEVSARYRATEKVVVFTAMGYTDVVNAETDQLVRDSGVTRQRFSFGVEYEGPKGFHASLLGRYNRWMSEPDVEPNDRKCILDGRLSKSFSSSGNKKATVFLNIYNLINSKYWSDISYPSPSRYFEGGVSVAF